MYFGKDAKDGTSANNWPRMTIIIASADDAIRGEALAVGFKFLLKPFGLADLTALTND